MSPLSLAMCHDKSGSEGPTEQRAYSTAADIGLPSQESGHTSHFGSHPAESLRGGSFASVSTSDFSGDARFFFFRGGGARE